MKRTETMSAMKRETLMPRKEKTRRWPLPRLAFPLFVGVALAPVAGFVVLPVLVLTGVLAPLPGALLGLGLFAVLVLGTAVVKGIEEWESGSPAARRGA